MNEDNMISKKDLLQRYGISYGALYRWKRMGLIPEDWFVKRATGTGQETFFPEQAVCDRIGLILSSKDESSLEELARSLTAQQKHEVTLVLHTVYGQKSYRVQDIQDVTITGADGMPHSVWAEVNAAAAAVPCTADKQEEV